MTRFTGPHPRRGASAPPAVLVDLGKQLLGELQNRIRMGGPPTLRLFREIEAGSVEAKMVAGNPQVFYTVKGGRETFITTSGIITWPGESVDAREAEFHPQEAVIPPPRNRTGTWGHFRYSPDTLGHGGAIDWRNADESIVLSWHGPANRYFDLTGNPFRSSLFSNGEEIFKIDDLPAAVRSGGTFTVRGAAVRESDLILLIATNSIDRVVRMPWSSGEPRSEEAEVLGERTRTFEEFETFFYHPWLFNQIGSEARCLRGFSPAEEDNQYIREIIMLLDDADEATFAASDTICPIVTQTTVETFDNSPIEMHTTREVGLFERKTRLEVAAAGGTLTVPLEPAPIDEYVNAAPGTAECVNGYTSTVTSVVSGSEWIKCGVDFRNNEPVYLERHITVRSSTSSASLIQVANISSLFASTSMTYVAYGVDELRVEGTATLDRSYTRSIDETYSSAFSATNGGFRLDNKEILSNWTIDTSVSMSMSIERSLSELWEDETFAISVFDDDYFKSPGWDENSLAFGEIVSSADVGHSYVEASSGTETVVSSTDMLTLMYADLREGFAAFALSTEEVVSTTTFSATKETPSSASASVSADVSRDVEWSQERVTGPFNLPASHWETSSSVGGTVTIRNALSSPAARFETSLGTHSVPGGSFAQYINVFGAPWYGGASGTTVAASQAAVYPPQGADVNTLFAQRLNDWSGWDAGDVFQQDADGVRCYGSWQHLRGHLVYSQIAGNGGTDLLYAAGTSGPAISTLNPKEPVGGQPALYHPMFIHTALRPQRFVAGA